MIVIRSRLLFYQLKYYDEFMGFIIYHWLDYIGKPDLCDNLRNIPIQKKLKIFNRSNKMTNKLHSFSCDFFGID
ncbi:hypothetical protein QQG55_35130 [Brugia pahangi]